MPLHTLYTEDDISLLLALMTQDNENVTVMPQTQLEHESLATNNAYHAVCEVMGDETKTRRRVLMPINVGSNHWISVMVRRQSNGRVQVICNDPLGSSFMEKQGSDKFIGMIRSIVGVGNFDFVDLQLEQQSTGVDCGPFVVDNLVKLSKIDDETLDSFCALTPSEARIKAINAGIAFGTVITSDQVIKIRKEQEIVAAPELEKISKKLEEDAKRSEEAAERSNLEKLESHRNFIFREFVNGNLALNEHGEVCFKEVVESSKAPTAKGKRTLLRPKIDLVPITEENLSRLAHPSKVTKEVAEKLRNEVDEKLKKGVRITPLRHADPTSNNAHGQKNHGLGAYLATSASRLVTSTVASASKLLTEIKDTLDEINFPEEQKFETAPSTSPTGSGKSEEILTTKNFLNFIYKTNAAAQQKKHEAQQKQAHRSVYDLLKSATESVAKTGAWSVDFTRVFVERLTANMLFASQSIAPRIYSAYANSQYEITEQDQKEILSAITEALIYTYLQNDRSKVGIGKIMADKAVFEAASLMLPGLAKVVPSICSYVMPAPVNAAATSIGQDLTLTVSSAVAPIIDPIFGKILPIPTTIPSVTDPVTIAARLAIDKIRSNASGLMAQAAKQTGIMLLAGVDRAILTKTVRAVTSSLTMPNVAYSAFLLKDYPRIAAMSVADYVREQATKISIEAKSLPSELPHLTALFATNFAISFLNDAISDSSLREAIKLYYQHEIDTTPKQMFVTDSLGHTISLVGKDAENMSQAILESSIAKILLESSSHVKDSVHQALLGKDKSVSEAAIFQATMAGVERVVPMLLETLAPIISQIVGKQKESDVSKEKSSQANTKPVTEEKHPSKEENNVPPKSSSSDHKSTMEVTSTENASVTDDDSTAQQHSSDLGAAERSRSNAEINEATNAFVSEYAKQDNSWLKWASGLTASAMMTSGQNHGLATTRNPVRLLSRMTVGGLFAVSSLSERAAAPIGDSSSGSSSVGVDPSSDNNNVKRVRTRTQSASASLENSMTRTVSQSAPVTKTASDTNSPTGIVSGSNTRPSTNTRKPTDSTSDTSTPSASDQVSITKTQTKTYSVSITKPHTETESGTSTGSGPTATVSFSFSSAQSKTLTPPSLTVPLSRTPNPSRTFSAPASRTSTGTLTPPPTPSNTQSDQPTSSASRSLWSSLSASKSDRASPSMSITFDHTESASESGTTSSSVTASSSVTPSHQITYSLSETPSASGSGTQIISGSITVTNTRTGSSTETKDVSFSVSKSGQNTLSITPSLSASQTESPSTSISNSFLKSLSFTLSQEASQTMSGTWPSSMTPSDSGSAVTTKTLVTGTGTKTGTGPKSHSVSISERQTPSSSASGSFSKSISMTFTPENSGSPSETNSPTTTISFTPTASLTSTGSGTVTGTLTQHTKTGSKSVAGTFSVSASRDSKTGEVTLSVTPTGSPSSSLSGTFTATISEMQSKSLSWMSTMSFSKSPTRTPGKTQTTYTQNPPKTSSDSQSSDHTRTPTAFPTVTKSIEVTPPPCIGKDLTTWQKLFAFLPEIITGNDGKIVTCEDVPNPVTSPPPLATQGSSSRRFGTTQRPRAPIHEQVRTEHKVPWGYAVGGGALLSLAAGLAGFMLVTAKRTIINRQIRSRYTSQNAGLSDLLDSLERIASSKLELSLLPHNKHLFKTDRVVQKSVSHQTQMFAMVFDTALKHAPELLDTYTLEKDDSTISFTVSELASGGNRFCLVRDNKGRVVVTKNGDRIISNLEGVLSSNVTSDDVNELIETLKEKVRERLSLSSHDTLTMNTGTAVAIKPDNAPVVKGAGSATKKRLDPSDLLTQLDVEAANKRRTEGGSKKNSATLAVSMEEGEVGNEDENTAPTTSAGPSQETISKELEAEDLRLLSQKLRILGSRSKEYANVFDLKNQALERYVFECKPGTDGQMLALRKSMTTTGEFVRTTAQTVFRLTSRREIRKENGEFEGDPKLVSEVVNKVTRYYFDPNYKGLDNPSLGDGRTIRHIAEPKIIEHEWVGFEEKRRLFARAASAIKDGIVLHGVTMEKKYPESGFPYLADTKRPNHTLICFADPNGDAKTYLGFDEYGKFVYLDGQFKEKEFTCAPLPYELDIKGKLEKMYPLRTTDDSPETQSDSSSTGSRPILSTEANNNNTSNALLLRAGKSSATTDAPAIAQEGENFRVKHGVGPELRRKIIQDLCYAVNKIVTSGGGLREQDLAYYALAKILNDDQNNFSISERLGLTFIGLRGASIGSNAEWVDGIKLPIFSREGDRVVKHHLIIAIHDRMPHIFKFDPMNQRMAMPYAPTLDDLDSLLTTANPPQLPRPMNQIPVDRATATEEEGETVVQDSFFSHIATFLPRFIEVFLGISQKPYSSTKSKKANLQAPLSRSMGDENSASHTLPTGSRSRGSICIPRKTAEEEGSSTTTLYDATVPALTCHDLQNLLSDIEKTILVERAEALTAEYKPSPQEEDKVIEADLTKLLLKLALIPGDDSGDNEFRVSISRNSQDGPIALELFEIADERSCYTVTFHTDGTHPTVIKTKGLKQLKEDLTKLLDKKVAYMHPIRIVRPSSLPAQHAGSTLDDNLEEEDNVSPRATAAMTSTAQGLSPNEVRPDDSRISADASSNALQTGVHHTGRERIINGLEEDGCAMLELRRLLDKESEIPTIGKSPSAEGALPLNPLTRSTDL